MVRKFFYLFWLWPMFLPAQPLVKPAGITFQVHAADSVIDILLNGQKITAYRFSQTLEKPVLYPLLTLSAKPITRGYPLDPRPGERIDHPHHLGWWLNYGDVNGLDFWNNSAAIPLENQPWYGKIWHDDYALSEANQQPAILTVNCRWKNYQQETLLQEKTTYTFWAIPGGYCIDRTTTLTAAQDILFKDNKEGFIGLRVARQLEMPSDKPDLFTDAQGRVTAVKALDNIGVTGNYLSSESLTGDAVWGTRGRWVQLQGKLNGDPVSVVLIDHPDNVGYPTYWHARGYGLFAANPLGQAVFSNGKETLNFALKKGQQTTFRYRLCVQEGEPLPVKTIEEITADFTNRAKPE